jgi:hypothetical protein
MDPAPKAKTDWRSLAILCIPAVLTMSAMSSHSETLLPYFAFGGSAIAAIVSGQLEVRRFNKPLLQSIFFGLMIAIPYYVLSVMFCFGGCVCGNYLSH